MKKAKKIISMLIIISMLLASTPCYAESYTIVDNDNTVYQPKQEKISDNEYLNYAEYDIEFTDEKGRIINKDTSLKQDLKYNLIKNEINKLAKLETKSLGDNLYFEKYQYDSFVNFLPDFDSIVEIAYIKAEDTERYVIDYYNTKNERVILEYYSNGFVNKTIYNILTGDMVNVNNNNQKTLYDKNFLSGQSKELSKEQLDKIKELLTQNKLDEIKSMDGIEVQESDDGIVINIAPHKSKKTVNDNANAFSIPIYKTNAYPVTNSFPLLYKSYEASRTVLSDILKTYNKSDCNVYAKVFKKRYNYIEQKFDWQTFGINTAFSVIGIFLGAGTTVVSQVMYYASIAWGIVGGVQSTLEVSDIARDAMYQYMGEKNGYVYDKTCFYADVLVYINMGLGTIDGGLLPSGEWAWIESPPSSAYDVSNNYILDRTISDYNSSIVWGDGYTTYYPE